MKAIDLYALDIFLRICKNFPKEFHQDIMLNCKMTYARWQWPFLSRAEKAKFQQMEADLFHASVQGKAMIPLHVDGNLELMELECSQEDILHCREVRDKVITEPCQVGDALTPVAQDPAPRRPRNILPEIIDEIWNESDLGDSVDSREEFGDELEHNLTS